MQVEHEHHEDFIIPQPTSVTDLDFTGVLRRIESMARDVSYTPLVSRGTGEAREAPKPTSPQTRTPKSPQTRTPKQWQCCYNCGDLVLCDLPFFAVRCPRHRGPLTGAKLFKVRKRNKELHEQEKFVLDKYNLESASGN